MRNEQYLKALRDAPPWDWPPGAGERLLEIIRDRGATKAERELAADLAGDFTVINDELARALLSIVRRGDEPERLRAKAAISLGPALEHTDSHGFEDDIDEPPIGEETFREIQQTLHAVFDDTTAPKEVRRRVLEAAVRAPQDWHRAAIRDAYAVEDSDWKLTAVFGMQYVRGFDNQILEALDSANPDIHCEAVCAAGNWELDAAWPHVADLVTSEDTDKELLLAAIHAVASIRPQEAWDVLGELTDSDDEDIAEAAQDALNMEDPFGEDDEDDDDDYF